MSQACLGKSTSILVPRARRFLVTWSGNEVLWKQPLPDVRGLIMFLDWSARPARFEIGDRTLDQA